MAYRNPAQCLNLLRDLPNNDPLARLKILSNIITGLLAAPPGPDQHFEILEVARPLLAKTRAKLPGLDGDEPLPPSSEHNKPLLRTIELWRACSRSYAIVGASLSHGPLEGQKALLAQRRVYYTGKIVSEYLRAHRKLPQGLWREVHESFRSAEAANIHQIRVADSLNTIWKAQSALEAYITVLLLDIANAYGRSGQEWTWICRWAERFAPYCTLDPNIRGKKPTTYGVDPLSDHGLRPLGLLLKDATPRYFDCNKLASQIQSVFAQFKQGVSPASLGLGEDCSVDASARLLLSLYRPWGLASAGRRFPRRGSTGVVDLCAEWLSIGFHVKGTLFEQPHTSPPYAPLPEKAQRNFDEQRVEADRLGLICEQWELLDQSVGGFRLGQRPTAERLSHHQLVGLRVFDGEYYQLGQVSWLMYRDDGLLEAGIHLLPGLPRVVAVRPVSDEERREPYTQAFIIEANEVLQIETSLILPEGWYKTNGLIEINDGTAHRQFKMKQLLLKGPNFQQIAFE